MIAEDPTGTGTMLMDEARTVAEDILDSAVALSDPNPQTLLALEGEALRKVRPQVRVLVLAHLGAGFETAHPAQVTVREYASIDTIEIVVDLFGVASLGAFRDVRVAEKTWKQAIGLDPEASYLAAATLGLAGELPARNLSAESITELPDIDTAKLLAFAVGRAATKGSPLGVKVARELLSEKEASPYRIPVLKGLGEGCVEAGIAWLLLHSERATKTRDDWAASCWEAGLTLAERGHNGWDGLAAEGLKVLTDSEAATQALVSLKEALEGGAWTSFQEWALARWSHWPNVVRAALLKFGPKPPAEPAFLADRDNLVLQTLLKAPWVNEVAHINPYFVRRLRSHPDVAIRRLAAQRLNVEYPKPTTRPETKKAEVIALGAHRDSLPALDQLRIALAKRDTAGLEPAIQELDAHAAPEAIAAMLAASEAMDLKFRRTLLKAIATIGDSKWEHVILTMMRKYRGLDLHALKALCKLKESDAVTLVARLLQRRLRWADLEICRVFHAYGGDRAEAHLLEALKTRFFPPARIGAAKFIAEAGIKRGIFGLRRMALSDSHPDARTAAVKALRKLGGTIPSPAEQAGYGLSYCEVSDIDQAVKRAKQAGRGTLPGLRHTIAKGSWMRRRAACVVLEAIDSEEANEILKERLADVDEDVRLAAITSLRRRSWRPETTDEVTWALGAARQLTSGSEVTHARSTSVLMQMMRLGGHLSRTSILEVLLDRQISDAPDDFEALKRITRLDWQGAVEAPNGVEATLRALDLTWQSMPHRQRLARGLARIEVDELQRALAQVDPGWRALEALCHVIGQTQDPARVVILQSYMTHQDDDVRNAAIGALAMIGGLEAAQALERGADNPFRQDRIPVAKALASIGHEADVVIKGMMESEWWGVRELAAEVFSHWRGDLQVATDNLLMLATDPEVRVCQTAILALRKHGLVGTVEGSTAVLKQARTESVPHILPWLNMSAVDANLATTLIEHWSKEEPDAVVLRIGILAELGLSDGIEWLEEQAQSHKHAGLRAAASDALAVFHNAVCRTCQGAGTLACPACDSRGEVACEACEGEATIRVICDHPDCTARLTTRDIGSRPCGECRGRGEVSRACECLTGWVRCTVCHGAAELCCPSCEGTTLFRFV